MSVRMRHTRAQTNNRRSHHALVEANIVTDKETGNLRFPHHIDEVTGMYRGKQIAKQKVKVENAKKVPQGKLTETDHERVREHTPTVEGSKGIIGKIAEAARPRSRSGMGGGA